MKSGSFYVTTIEVEYFVIHKTCFKFLMLATDADANQIIFTDAMQAWELLYQNVLLILLH